MRKSEVVVNWICSYGPLVCAIIFMFFIARASADYEDGVNAAFDGDFDTAFLEFTIAAESGLDLAQYNLGILYFTGQGCYIVPLWANRIGLRSRT